ncbi:MAG: hypothetical protein DHS20C11_12280 [Lysobacteraceae bacterium]|nr:MAG: hypothetical protein DHS20C11_12280 [Xanthomonadaceae bacterium]
MAAARKKKAGAKRRATPRRTKQPLPAWLWLIAGVILGVGLAVAMVKMGLAPNMPEELTASPDQVSPPPSEEIAAEPQQTPEENKPRYDFYTLLPEMDVVVPEEEIAARRENRERLAEQRGAYLLQVGSFQSSADADELKARLTLLGLVPEIQTVTVNDTMWHRVRLGPFESVRDLEVAKHRVEAEGLHPMVLRER